MSKQQVYGAVDRVIAQDYDIVDRIGRGAYGIVWKARRRKGNQEIVAIKKVYDAFRNTVDAQRTYREVVYLKAFMEHENIITLLDVIRPESDRDIYLVFDHMDTDLKRAVDAKILTAEHEAYIMYQILRGVHYMHSADVIHRDLKPDNILLNAACDVKIADLGLARSVSHDWIDASSEGGLTEYVATRWYRSPEILLGSPKYRHTVDIWSIGCIFGYVLRGEPLFAGSSSNHQVALIVQCLGKPSADAIEAIDAPYAAILIGKMSAARRTSLRSLCPKASASALDLLSLMLNFHPDRRPRTSVLLPHGYLRSFRQPRSEKTMKCALGVPHVNDPDMQVDDYRQKLYEAAVSKEFNAFLHPPPAPSSPRVGQEDLGNAAHGGGRHKLHGGGGDAWVDTTGEQGGVGTAGRSHRSAGLRPSRTRATTAAPGRNADADHGGGGGVSSHRSVSALRRETGDRRMDAWGRKAGGRYRAMDGDRAGRERGSAKARAVGGGGSSTRGDTPSSTAASGLAVGGQSVRKAERKQSTTTTTTTTGTTAGSQSQARRAHQLRNRSSVFALGGSEDGDDGDDAAGRGHRSNRSIASLHMRSKGIERTTAASNQRTTVIPQTNLRGQRPKRQPTLPRYNASPWATGW